jgi:hypothetical protein
MDVAHGDIEWVIKSHLLGDWQLQHRHQKETLIPSSFNEASVVMANSKCGVSILCE